MSLVAGISKSQIGELERHGDREHRCARGAAFAASVEA